jgi:hypothetical protein
LRFIFTRLAAPIASFLALALPSSLALAEDLPQLDWDKPVRCMKNTKGEEVRVQCDDAPPGLRRCLVAPNAMTTYTGELERVQPCTVDDDPDVYKKLVASGSKMVPAIAEAPPGYARSTQGRVYQVKFDLLNRIYLGLSWLPSVKSTESGLPELSLGRARAETGLHISVLSPRGRSRHDIRILDGSAAFSDMELQGLLFSYDYQHLHRRPAFWISTFIGPPRVYPVTPGIGWGFRLININDRPPAFRDTLDMEFIEAHLSWNPWQSNDMYSHLRFEVGGDVGKFWEDRGELSDGLGTGRVYAGLTSAVKARFSLGEGGLHYVFLDVAYLRPTFVDEPYTGTGIHRVKAAAAYEGIFFAINDQPVSFRFAAVGSSRQDLISGRQTIEATATVGLRFSFWAPPRVFEPLPDFEEP